MTPSNLFHVSEKHVVSIFRAGVSLEILMINKPRHLGMRNFVRREIINISIRCVQIVAYEEEEEKSCGFTA
jgi:hypothetical protein